MAELRVVMETELAGNPGNKGHEGGYSVLPSAREKVVQHKKLGVGSRSPWDVLNLRVLWGNRMGMSHGAWHCKESA